MRDLVGEAYVRIIGDTSGMRNAVQKAGKEGGAAYGDAFMDSFEAESKSRLQRMRTQLQRGLLDPKEFDRQAKAFGSIAEAASAFYKQLDFYQKQAKNSGDRRWDDMRRDIAAWAAQAQAVKDLADAEALRDAEARKAEKERQKAATAELARMQTLKAAVEKAYRAGYSGNFRERNIIIDKFGSDSDFTAMLRNRENRLVLFGNTLDRQSDKITAFGLGFGRVFGKGSRNNFLNFFGSVMANAFAPLRGIAELGARAVAQVGQLAGVFSQARAAGSSFAAALGQVGTKIGAGLVRFLPALVAAVLAAAAAIPMLVSGLWLLVAALTALAGGVVMGLLGGLVALGPAVVALGAAIGAGSLLFSRFRVEGSKAAEALDSIKKSWEKVARSVEDEADSIAMHFAEAFEPLAEEHLGPIFKGTMRALDGVVQHFGSVFNNPQMSAVLDQWETKIPTIVSGFGNGLNNMLAGLVHFFTPILDFTVKLSGNFESMMENFRGWAASAEGQSSIKRWMEDAWKSASDLWGILQEVGKALFTILDFGNQDAGGTMLEKIKSKLVEFNDWLKSPSNRQTIKQWFEDGLEVAGDLKDIIGDIFKALKELDTPEGRDNFKKMLELAKSLSTVVIGIAKGLAVVSEIIKAVTGPWVPSQGSGTDTKKDKIPDWAKRPTDDPWGLGQPSFGKFGVIIKMTPENVAVDNEGILAKLTKPFFDSGPRISKILSGLGPQVSLSVGGLGAMIAAAMTSVPTLMAQPFVSGNVGVSGVLTGLGSLIPLLLGGIPGTISAILSPVVTSMAQPFLSGNTQVSSTLLALSPVIFGLLSPVGGTIAALLSPVASSMRGPFESGKTGVSSALAQVTGAVITGLSPVGAAVSRALSGVAGALSGPFEAGWRAISAILSRINAAVSSAVSAAARIARIASSAPKPFAKGGTVYGPTSALIGEAGPEAVVPLNRPLSLVDPSVRWLSAIAQGKTSFASGGIAGGRSLVIMPGAIVVQAPNADPGLVAEAVLDRFAASVH